MYGVMVVVSALVTAVFTATFLRLWDVATTVRQHDELVRNRNEDLRTWVGDDDRVMEDDIAEKQMRAAEAGLGEGGAQIQIRDKVTAIHEHYYRDQRRGAERAVRDAQLSELWMHHLYRRIRRKPFLTLNAPEEVAAITDRWRERRSAT